MGLNFILPLIAGIVMTTILGSSIGPSFIEKIKATKVEAKAINNQEVIFEAVKRYITMKQTNPTKLQDIINEKFLNDKVNDNGFGGGYSIEIDGSKGLLKVKTTIEDPKAQETFVNSFKNKFIPTRVGTTNEFETTFVIPTDIMHGRGLFMTGIPVQATPPTDTSLKYWYDTSGKEVALRMYDPNSNTWKKVAGTSGSGSISEGALVDASGNNFTKDTLPTTDAEVGEIKYAYDSTTNSIQEYVYAGTDKGWVVKGGGGNNTPNVVGLDPNVRGCPYGFIPIPNSKNVNGAPIGMPENRSKFGWCVMKYMFLPYEPSKHTYDTYGLAWQDSYDIDKNNYKVISRANNTTNYLNNISNYNAKNICKNSMVNDKGEFLDPSFETISMPYNLYKLLVNDLFKENRNWTGGAFNSGKLYVGHSDGAPYSSIAPNYDDSLGYYLTENSTGDQRRTMYTSEKYVIWDIVGNFWEHLYEGQNASNNANLWREYKNINKTTHPFSPNVLLGVDASTYDSTKGLGLSIYDNGSATIANIGSSATFSYWLLRGSNFGNGASYSGLSTSHWSTYGLSTRGYDVSGRCVAKRLFE